MSTTAAGLHETQRLCGMTVAGPASIFANMLRVSADCRVQGKTCECPYLGEFQRISPLRADHDIMAGLIPEVIPIFCGGVSPGSFHL